MEPGRIEAITGARPLGIFGDSVTTDHISPAGAIKKSSPAGKYLVSHGVAANDFNSYGSRRGNDRVMTRGTFANVRIKNLMVPGVEGGVTKHFPDGEQLSIYRRGAQICGRKSAARDFRRAGIRHRFQPRLGRERHAPARRESRRRRRASSAFTARNLVGMGVLPLQFQEGVNAQTLELDGTETFDFLGIDENLKPAKQMQMRVTRASGEAFTVPVRCRIDTPIEIDYYQHGGILPFVLRQLLS